MSRTTVVVEVKQDFLDSIECDKCGKFVDLSETPLGECNFTRIANSFGYFSQYFGDMTVVDFDLCEACLHDFTLTLKNNVIKDEK